MREQRRRIAARSDVLEENVESNENGVIRQGNTSSNNQAIGENVNETAEATEHVSSFGENEYTDEELELAERLNKTLENAEKSWLPSLRTVNKSVLKREVKRMNQLLAKIRGENITTTNDLIYAAAVVITENAGVKIKKGRKQDELETMCWKLFTSMIAESIYTFLDDKLFPEEQKGCRKGSRGTNDLLYID